MGGSGAAEDAGPVAAAEGDATGAEAVRVADRRRPLRKGTRVVV